MGCLVAKVVPQYDFHEPSRQCLLPTLAVCVSAPFQAITVRNESRTPAIRQVKLPYKETKNPGVSTRACDLRILQTRPYHGGRRWRIAAASAATSLAQVGAAGTNAVAVTTYVSVPVVGQVGNVPAAPPAQSYERARSSGSRSQPGGR
jgi:hypothetical protein